MEATYQVAMASCLRDWSVGGTPSLLLFCGGIAGWARRELLPESLGILDDAWICAGQACVCEWRGDRGGAVSGSLVLILLPWGATGRTKRVITIMLI